MKIKNKETGRVVTLWNNTDGSFPDTIKELAEEWEDYEEPKEGWFIQSNGLVKILQHEAEKAVRRLKAWRRLKDKGFKFVKVDDVERVIHFEIPYRVGYDSCEAEADLDLLFSGEDD